MKPIGFPKVEKPNSMQPNKRKLTLLSKTELILLKRIDEVEFDLKKQVERLEGLIITLARELDEHKSLFDPHNILVHTK